MNENDLRTLLVDRADSAAAAASLPADDRLDAVQGRVRGVRRRRAGLAAVGTAAVVTAAAVALPASLGGSPPPPGPAGVTESPDVDPSPTVSRINGFLEYDQGGRLLGAEVGRLPRRTVEVTVTPQTLNLSFGESCAFRSRVVLRVLVNGRFLYGGDCTRQAGDSSVSRIRPRLDERYGVRVGEPMTVTVRAVKGVRYTRQGPVDRPLPSSGEFGIGVYQGIDPAQ